MAGRPRKNAITKEIAFNALPYSAKLPTNRRYTFTRAVGFPAALVPSGPLEIVVAAWWTGSASMFTTLANTRSLACWLGRPSWCNRLAATQIVGDFFAKREVVVAADDRAGGVRDQPRGARWSVVM